MKIIKQLLRNPLSLLGIILLAFFGLVAVFAPWLAPPPNPYEPYRIAQFGYSPTPKPPTGPNPFAEIWAIVIRKSDFSKTHPFGTTEGQYDVYYGIIWGTRTAFLAGICITGVTALIGVAWGSLAGHDIHAHHRYFPLPNCGHDHCRRASIADRPQHPHRRHRPHRVRLEGYARLIRGDILSVKERDYVQAARAAGSGHRRITLRHILPNAIFPTLVVASMDIDPT